MISPSSRSSSFILGTVLLRLLCLSSASRGTSSSGSYADFRLEHRNEEEESSVSYKEREALYEAAVAEVAEHNKKGLSWTLALNRFADFTPSEMGAMLGYKRVGRKSSGGSSLLQTADHELESIDTSHLAKTVDWTSKLNFSNFVHNQGSCGSCWAHAAVAALEAHSELTTGKAVALSTQEIIDCTANPHHCGGTGGCQGATAEEAFEEAKSHGIAEEKGYTGKKGHCASRSSGHSGRNALNLQSYVRLPENRGSYLLNALAQHGPVVMSVDAGSLFRYNDGVFAGCKPDTVVNHAVLGVGYGTDKKSGKDYYMIKNSWGETWGENGYFRMQRFNDDSEYCGWDNKPKEGVFCDDAPARVRVCGMCGGTSDSAYPIISKAALPQQSHFSDISETPRLHSKLSKARTYSVL